jgi:hypothetical protein
MRCSKDRPDDAIPWLTHHGHFAACATWRYMTSAYQARAPCMRPGKATREVYEPSSTTLSDS